jgi:adenosine kinase
VVGSDFGEYAEWLDRHGIRRDWIHVLDDAFTAQAFITTDLDDNQITAFHSGAMDRAHEARLESVEGDIEIAVVSPNGKQAMQDYARGLKARGIPTVVDPGQGLPLFEGDELVELLDGAAVYIANDYEWSLTLQKTGLDEDAIAQRVGAIVVTRGEQGSWGREGDRRFEVPPVRAAKVVDPTGCGDAYRAGLLLARQRGLPLEVACRLGSVLGALKVARQRPQSLDLDLDAVRQHYIREFGSDF